MYAREITWSYGYTEIVWVDVWYDLLRQLFSVAHNKVYVGVMRFFLGVFQLLLIRFT